MDLLLPKVCHCTQKASFVPPSSHFLPKRFSGEEWARRCPAREEGRPLVCYAAFLLHEDRAPRCLSGVDPAAPPSRTVHDGVWGEERGRRETATPHPVHFMKHHRRGGRGDGGRPARGRTATAGRPPAPPLSPAPGCILPFAARSSLLLGPVPLPPPP